MKRIQECFPTAVENELSEADADSFERLVRTSLRKIRMMACLGSPEFTQHLVATASEALLLARALGLGRSEQEAIWWAASLHDIGKVGIAREILVKTGDLDSHETREVRNHTTLGHQILSGVDHELYQRSAEVAFFHHERWDGKGYPRRLVGVEIPLSARIVAIADVYDCVTAGRPYCGPRTSAEALGELEAHAGTQFDPELVSVFLSMKKLPDGSSDRRTPG